MWRRDAGHGHTGIDFGDVVVVVVIAHERRGRFSQLVDGHGGDGVVAGLIRGWPGSVVI